MTLWTLVQKNLFYKPLRTALLLMCISAAFALYGLMGSFIDSSQGAKGTADDMLVVISPNQALPMAMKAKIAALEQARDTVLIGQALMTAQGWSIGQTIALTAWQMTRIDGSRAWPFTVAGVFEAKNANTDTYFMIGRYDYVNAARAHGRDTVDMFAVQPQEGASASQLATQIDRFFANSPTPTKTQSEKQLLEAFLRQYADVSLIVDLVASASFIALLMIVVNSLVFTVRERSGQIGLQKALSFSHRLLLTLILSETLLLFLSGCAIGLGIAGLASLLADQALGLVLSGAVIAKALALCIVLALLSGALIGFLSLAAGFERTLHATGSPFIAVALESASRQETNSDLSPDTVRAIAALDPTGSLLFSRELVVPVEADFDGRSRTVALRGMDRTSRGSAFESEIWGDLEAVSAAFNRQDQVQSVRLRLETPQALTPLSDALSKIAPLTVILEKDLYAAQSERLSSMIRLFGWPIALLMAVGASVGTLNAMTIALNQRTVEIATLRALGFARCSVFAAILAEAMALASLGALLGAAASWLLFNGWQSARSPAHRQLCRDRSAAAP